MTNNSAAGGLGWMIANSHAAEAATAAIMLCAELISIQAMTSWRQAGALTLTSVRLARLSAAAAAASNR